MSEISSEEIEKLFYAFPSQQATQNEITPPEEVYVEEDNMREFEEEHETEDRIVRRVEQQELIDQDNFGFVFEPNHQFNGHNYLLSSVEILQQEREEIKRKTSAEKNRPDTIKFVAHMMLELSLIKYNVDLPTYLRYYNEDRIWELSEKLLEVKRLIKKYNEKMPDVMRSTFLNYFENIKTDFTEENLNDVSRERLEESIRKSRITLYDMYLQFGQNLLEAVALRYLYNIKVLPVHFNTYFGEQYLGNDVKHNFPITFKEGNTTYMNIALFPGFCKQDPEVINDSFGTKSFDHFIAALTNINRNLKAVAINGWTNVLKGYFSGKKLKLKEDVKSIIEFVDELDAFMNSTNTSETDDVKDARARDKKPRPVRQPRKKKILKIEDVIEILPQILTSLKQTKNLQKFFPKK